MTSEQRDGHTVAPEMSIHEDGDHLVVAEAPPDLERSVERLPHFEALRTPALLRSTLGELSYWLGRALPEWAGVE